MKAIESRDDVRDLVHAFYAKVREDDLLGPIFNGRIPADKWPQHLDRLTDFWEANLFEGKRFMGSPSQKHIAVDASMNHTMSQDHFAQWLRLWFATLDEHFQGPTAEKAKQSARRMATGQYIHVWRHRQEK